MQSKSHKYVAKHLGLPKIIHKPLSIDKQLATDILKPVEMKKNNESMPVEDHQSLLNPVPLDREWAGTCHNIYDSHFVVIKHEICSDNSDFENTTAKADFSFENIVCSENNSQAWRNELEFSVTGASLSGGYTQIIKPPLPLECMRMKSGLHSMKKDIVPPQEASIKPTEAHVPNEQEQNNLLNRRSFEECLKSSRETVWKPQGTTANGNTEASNDSAGLLKQVSSTYKSQLVIRNGQSVIEKRQPVIKKKKTVSKKSQPVQSKNQSINFKNLQVIKKKQSFDEKRQPVFINNQSVAEKGLPVINNNQSVTEKSQPVKKKRMREVSFIEKSLSVIENSQPVVNNNQSVTEESQPVIEKSQPVFKNSLPGTDKSQQISDRPKISIPNKLNSSNPPITKINLIYRRKDATRKYRRPTSLLSNELVSRQNGTINFNETDERNDSSDSKLKDLVSETDSGTSVNGNRERYTENRKPATQNIKPIFDRQNVASSNKQKNLEHNKSSCASGTNIILTFRRKDVFRKYRETKKSLSPTENDRSVGETSHPVSGKRKVRFSECHTNVSPTARLRLLLRRKSDSNNYVIVQPNPNQNKKKKLTNSLVRRKSIHTVDKPYVCKYGGFKPSTRQSLKIQTAKHKRMKTYSCRLCDFKCTHRSQYKCHMRTHTGDKPYSCKFCVYKCAQASGLQNHMRTHTGEKPYSCKFCVYKCAQASGLQNHMRTHTGEKPYSCQFCVYKCAQASGLQNHMRTHTGEKPYSCQLCVYKCAQASGLQNHMRKHTGEKPYSCQFCVYKCAQASGLATHMRTHTGE